MKYWLMKSEPSECSVDDALAAKNATVPWVGVRNYQARNFMRDDMQIGDGVLFYHSSCAEPGVVGIAEVASTPYPDPTQFDPQSHYFDPTSKPEQPRWLLVDVQPWNSTGMTASPGCGRNSRVRLARIASTPARPIYDGRSSCRTIQW